MRLRWPDMSLSPGVSPEVAVDIASQLRGSLKLDACSRLQLPSLLEAGGFALRRGELGAERGGREALLLPRAVNRFDIVVDPTPRGGWRCGESMRARTCEHRVRFRVAHEVAHSFFYERGVNFPYRSTRTGSRIEEAFCDRFAQELLLPAAVLARCQPPGNDLFGLADRFGVSVETAARGFAAASGGSVQVAVLYTAAGSFHQQWSSNVEWADHALGLAAAHASEATPVAYADGAALVFDSERKQALAFSPA
jgi:IrrE N-terminal-like domain